PKYLSVRTLTPAVRADGLSGAAARGGSGKRVPEGGIADEPTPCAPPRLHPGGTAGRDRNHRDPDRPAPAGRPAGPPRRRPPAVPEQPQTDRPGPAPASRHRRGLPVGPRHALPPAVLLELAGQDPALPRARQP